MNTSFGDDATPPVVIDTNVALDLWVFGDPAAQPLRVALAQGAVRWLATAGMRDELARVLGYPNIAARLSSAGPVMAAFDAHAELTPPAAPSSVRCRDVDDQPFIDLAVAQRATLVSKDACVLGLARRLAALGVSVQRVWQ